MSRFLLLFLLKAPILSSTLPSELHPSVACPAELSERRTWAQMVCGGQRQEAGMLGGVGYPRQ